jgi:hypothetical protein
VYCEEYDLLGGSTSTTLKEQLAHAVTYSTQLQPHKYGALLYREQMQMLGFAWCEVTQYQALFIGKISQKRKVKSWIFKNEVILEDFNARSQKEIVKVARYLYLDFSV